METRSCINFLTALFLPPAVVPVGGTEVWVHVPSGLAVAQGRGHSSAIAPRLDFILSLEGTGQTRKSGGGGKGGKGNQPLGGDRMGRDRTGRDGVVRTLQAAEGCGVLCHVLPPVPQTNCRTRRGGLPPAARSWAVHSPGHGSVITASTKRCEDLLGGQNHISARRSVARDNVKRILDRLVPFLMENARAGYRTLRPTAAAAPTFPLVSPKGHSSPGTHLHGGRDG